MEEKKVKLAAPWVIYANQIEAMFKEDKDIVFDYDDGNKVITLRVNGNDKADALSQLLPAKKTFGNVSIDIKIIPANDEDTRTIDLFRKAFNGNPIISEITTVNTMQGALNFVVFKPKVVQYHNDHMYDLNGICSTIYQDLAKEIFGWNNGIFYCTEKIVD